MTVLLVPVGPGSGGSRTEEQLIGAVRTYEWWMCYWSNKGLGVCGADVAAVVRSRSGSFDGLDTGTSRMDAQS